MLHWYALQPFYRRWTTLHQILDTLAIPYLHPYQFKPVTHATPNPDTSQPRHLATSTPRNLDTSTPRNLATSTPRNLATSQPSSPHQAPPTTVTLRPVPVLQMLFIYASPDDLHRIRTATYEHARILSDRTATTWTPLTIPDHQLLEFHKALSLDARYDIVEDRPDLYRKGECVRVIGGGKYEGLEGTICRIKHNRHLIVRINGVCAITTDYIPQAFLQKIDSTTSSSQITSHPTTIHPHTPNSQPSPCESPTPSREQTPTPQHTPTREPLSMQIAELAYHLRTLPAIVEAEATLKATPCPETTTTPTPDPAPDTTPTTTPIPATIPTPDPDPTPDTITATETAPQTATEATIALLRQAQTLILTSPSLATRLDLPPATITKTIHRLQSLNTTQPIPPTIPPTIQSTLILAQSITHHLYP